MIPPFGLVDATRSAAELAAMRRMLDASRGCPSFSIVTCNSPALRDWVIAELQRDPGGVEVVAITPEVVDVFGQVLSTASDANRSSLFVVDLEKALPSSDVEHLPLRSLNASRELWGQRFPCPTVLWVPEYVAALFPLHARDFTRFVSHRFEFVSERASARAGILDPMDGQLRLAELLSAKEKRFRIAELEQRIGEVGESPAPTLIPHVFTWVNELGFLYYLLGDLDRAEDFARRALEIAERLGDLRRVSRCYHNLGLVYRGRGAVQQAEEMLHKSLAMSKDLGDLDGSATDYVELGLLYQSSGSEDRAEQMHREALSIHRKLGDEEAVSFDSANLAAITRMSGDLDQAEAMTRKMIELHGRLRRRRDLANARRRLGKLLFYRGDLDGAEEQFAAATGTYEALGELPAMARCWSDLGLTAKMRGDGRRARELLTRSRDLFAQLDMLGDVESIQRSLDSLPQDDPPDAPVPLPDEQGRASVNDPQGPAPVANDRGNQENSNGEGTTG